MLTREQVNLVVGFLSDAAKIIFASLVVGIFVPGTTGEFPWLTFLLGLVITGAFLYSAIYLTKSKNI